MNDITVIAFYPGGGGNRYLRKLLNREFKTANISYDSKSVDPSTPIVDLYHRELKGAAYE